MRVTDLAPSTLGMPMPTEDWVLRLGKTENLIVVPQCGHGGLTGLLNGVNREGEKESQTVS